MPERRVPLLLEVLLDGKMVFVPFERVLNEPELRGQVIGKALAEVEEWRSRYGDLLEILGAVEAARIVETIDAVRRRMGDDWPTHGNDLYRTDQYDMDDDDMMDDE